jgi:hypothetical protein
MPASSASSSRASALRPPYPRQSSPSW